MNGLDTEAIELLVKKYRELKESGKIVSYNEEETKKDFILPLFEALDWEVYSKKEVSAEEHQSGGRVDYGFMLNSRVQFYLEAKALKADLNRSEFANQAIRYSWNKGITWAILTDFESLKVFNAQIISENLANKLFFEIHWENYLDQLDQLSLLSKQAFVEGLLDKEAEKWGKKLPQVSVTNTLYKDLNYCRERLTTSLGQQNPQVKPEDLDEGVQKLLDRLLFIRVAEDREIEDKTLIPLLREWQNSKTRNEVPLYKSMVRKFRELDKIYNSNLFTEHPFENWEDYSSATKDVIEALYGNEGYYEYDFKAIPSDVLGTVYENYLGYKLQKSKKGLAVNKDADKRKEQGIYYTPSFIVDYIVNNALEPILDKCTSIEELQKIKVLDPACGSGSFLIKALDMIFRKYREFGNTSDEEIVKTQILLQNIYGVDLDPQAVEIARLNLLINSLSEKMQLPSLSKNIKNGNSLISGTNEELKKYFGPDFRDKVPFNWREEFPDVFRQGGFDVVIGNPPYVRVQTLNANDVTFFNSHFKSAIGNYDLYILFIEKSLELLKENGIFGMILPNKFINNKYGEGIRQIIRENKVLKKLINFGNYQIFNEATTYTALLFLQKRINRTFMYIGQSDLITDNELDPSKLNNAKTNEIDSSLLDKSVWVMGKESTTSLMDKITNGHQKLEELTERIFQGLKTGCDPVYILKILSEDQNYIKVQADNGKEYNLENSLLHPLYKGTEMRSFEMLDTNKVIIFPYNQDGKLLKPDELATKYPEIYRYFIDNKSLLDKRENGKFSGDQFYQYSRNQALEVISKKKIITPDIAPKARFSLDNSGEKFFAGGVAGGYGIVLKQGIDYFTLTSLLNSDLLDWYLKNTSSKFRGDFFSYESRYISQLPIATINSPELNSLYKMLANLYLQKSKLLENSDKYEALVVKIQEMRMNINSEVYNLYDLTPEEIIIVEGEQNVS